MVILHRENNTNMTETEFLKYAASGATIIAGSKPHEVMHRMSQNALRLTSKLNGSYHTPDEVRDIMSDLTGKTLDRGFGMFPPFYTDCGKNITIGKNTFINMGCSFQDWGGIAIGDECLIGHNCTICTVKHDKNSSSRGNMTCSPVTIGNRVWIGANVTILPGVTIGDGAIIGAGAVVTKDISPETTAAGIPAKGINKTNR